MDLEYSPIILGDIPQYILDAFSFNCELITLRDWLYGYALFNSVEAGNKFSSKASTASGSMGRHRRIDAGRYTAQDVAEHLGHVA
jgi:hypothetical protein